MLPTTILLGLAFPIGLTLWAGDDASEDTSRRVGAFYSLNVFGAILGSVLAGFVLLPQLGSRASLIVTAGAGDGCRACCWRCRCGRPTRAPRSSIAVVAPALFLIGARARRRSVRRRLRALPPQRDAGVARGRRADHGGRSRPARQSADARHVSRRQPPGQRFAVHRVRAPSHRRAAGDAASEADGRRSSSASAAAPRPARSRAINVDVDVVELSHAVVGGSEFFKHINFDLLTRPNVRLHVDDGRNFLLMNRKKYDVITADIILPRHAGAGSLYSREYYELVRESLAEGGLVMQWNGGDSATEYKLLLRTFLSVFPHTTLWADGSLMLGSTTPFTISQTRVRGAPRQTFEQFPWDLATLKRIYTAGPDEAEGVRRRRPDPHRRPAGDRILPVAAEERRPRRLHRRHRRVRSHPDAVS